MQIVSQFVRFNPDEGGTDFVHGKVKIVEPDVFECREQFLCFRIPEFPERKASAGIVFPQAGLGLVNTHRHSLRHGRTPVFRRQILFINSMAGFMDHSENR